MAQTIKLKRSSTEGAEPSTSDLALGEVAINTYDGKMFIKKNDGSDSIVELGTGGGGEATYTKTTVTATANQTTVTGLTYTAGLVDVYLNGAKLLVGQDVTATNGTSIVLASGAAVNDILQIVAFKAGAAFTPASPTFTGTLTAPTINATTALQIGGAAITSTPVELNKLDGVTATTAELNLVAGLTPSTAELNHVNGVTSAIQTQINTKSAIASPTFTGTVTAPTINASTALQIGGVAVTSTAAELNYVDGVTSNIQTQIDAKGTVSNVVEDTTPQLGGNLDVQSSEITTSTSNGNIKVTPNGSGVFEVKGAGGGDGTLQLNCSANSHGVKIKSPPHSAAASYTLTLPNNDGDADQVLQTNGSGVLTWADTAGGATIDLEASGAIANGSAVQMNTDGTVSAAVLSYVSSPTVNEDHLDDTPSSGHHCCCYDHVNNQIYVFYKDTNSSNDTKWFCAVGIPDKNNDIAWTKTELGVDGASSSAWTAAKYIPSADKVLFAWNKSSYSLHMSMVKANSAGVATAGPNITSGAPSYSNEFLDIGYDPSTGKAIMYFSKYSSGNTYAKLMTISGNTITGGNEVQVADWNIENGQGVYDANSGKHVFISSNNSATDVDATVITVSGTSISAGTLTALFNNAYKASCWYDANIERVIVAYGDNGTIKIQARVLSISGTTPSVTSATTLGSVSTTKRPIGFYDSLSTKNYVRVDDDMYEMSTSTSSASLTTGTALYDVDAFHYGRQAHLNDSYAPDIGLHFWMRNGGGHANSASLTSTTLEADAVLGVVTSAYTDGQTATISTISSQATVSGVAAAKKYYAQRNGSLGTFKSDAYMGLGVGTNTLLVKG
jgi:hypothetical protein